MIFHISRELFLHFNIKRLENFFTFIYPRVADGRRGTGERTNYNKNLDFTSHSTRIISRKQLGMSSSMPADAGAMSSLEGSVFRRVSKNTIVRTAFSLFFFSFFYFSPSVCELLRVFVISSFHLRGRRHRSSSTDRSTGRFPGAAPPISSEQYTWENPVPRRRGVPPPANTASGQRKQEIRCTRYARDATASPILRIASPRSPSARTRVCVNLHPGSGPSSRERKIGFISFVRSPSNSPKTLRIFVHRFT